MPVFSIKVKSNKKARTFTIRTYHDGKFVSKYRTIPFPKLEFECMEYNTENDWRQFLKTSDYYSVN